MDENSSENHTPKVMDNVEAKYQKALGKLAENASSYVENFLTKAGFQGPELKLLTNLKQCMFPMLLNSVRKVIVLKSSISNQPTEDEKELLKNLESESNNTLFEHEPKMMHAQELINADLPIYLKNIMLNFGFHMYETENTHRYYVFFFSNAISYLSAIYTNLCKSQLTVKTSNGQNDKSEAQDSDQRKNLTEQSNPSNSSQDDITVVKELQSERFTMELITTTNKHDIYCLSNSSKSFTVKALKDENPSDRDMKHLDNELHIAKSISHPAFRSAVLRMGFQNKQVLLLEWVNGCKIKSFNSKEGFKIKSFLIIAREITSSLLAMNEKKIMHLNLTCDHIIFNPESNSIKIIGYGSATSFTSKKNYISNQELLEKDLRYISPEQTGRVNREIDYRSDFYSLGIIFYTILSGICPFESIDILNLIQMHILQEPIPLCSIDPEIPVPISDMVLKLMKKNAEERYQSAKGIIHDLDLMISEYDSDNKLGSVILAQHDQSETLLIPQTLYGRSNEYKILCSLFEKLTPTTIEIAFVVGKSGTGKSALVAELYKPVIQKNGFFICGKFDQSQQKPYSSLLAAVKNFCDHLLLKNKTILNKYKTRIQNAVSDEGKLLTDVISNLHMIIGEQLNISDAFGKEAKNRFNYVFNKFFEAICALSSPIFLVLEDLQWADVESLNLLSALVCNQRMKNFMFIGVYRENEVNNEHPLVHLLQDIRSKNISMREIKLDNLDHESVNDFISDALCLPELETYPLTAIIHEKTKGNPFFVNQTLKSLSDKGLVFFCNATSKWKWNTSIFGEYDISENVLELLRRKVLTFDKATQQTLKVATCLGNPFSLDILKRIVNDSSVIEKVLSAGMVTQHERSNTMYRFVHDRIQEAVFSLLPKDSTELYYYIGKKLCFLLSEDELNKNIFTVANLLHHATDVIENQEERCIIAEITMQAANKAMAITAFQQAFDYLLKGTELLNDSCWNMHYDETIKMYDLAAKAAYCIGNYTAMNAYIDTIVKNATSPLDLIQPSYLKIRFCNDKRMYDDAISVAVDILDKIDKNIELNRNGSVTSSDMHKAKCLLSGKSCQEILQMKTMELYPNAVMMILSSIISSAFYADSSLLFSISLQMVQLSLRYGISKYSPRGFAALGSVLCSRRDIVGYKMAKLGLMLLKKTQRKECIPTVYIIFYTLVSHFHVSIHDVFDPLFRSYKISLQTGNHDSCVLSCTAYVIYSFLSGKPLNKLLSDFEDITETLPFKIMSYLSVYQAVLNLLGEISENEDPAVLYGDMFKHTSCHDANEKRYNVSRASLTCAVMAYLFGDYSAALKFTETCKLSHESSFLSMFLYPVYLFYSGLVSLELAKNIDERDALVESAKESISKLKLLSDNAPMNFQNKCRLLQAELAVVVGNDQQAKVLYQESIKLSQQHGFIHEEALSCERAGLFYLNIDSSSASELLKQSYKCYARWGAVEKAKKFKKDYSSYLDIKSLDSRGACSFSNSDLQLDDSSNVSKLTETSAATLITSHTDKKRKL